MSRDAANQGRRYLTTGKPIKNMFASLMAGIGIFFGGVFYALEQSADYINNCSSSYERAYEDVLKNPDRPYDSLIDEHGLNAAMCPWSLEEVINHAKIEAGVKKSTPSS